MAETGKCSLKKSKSRGKITVKVKCILMILKDVQTLRKNMNTFGFNFDMFVFNTTFLF